MNTKDLFTLWLKWVAANALGEMIGLGATFAVLAYGMSTASAVTGAAGILLGYGLAIVTGGLEAAVVGWAQWRVLAARFPNIRLRIWWLATLVGVLIAYSLGYLPSTILSLQEQSTQTPVVEPEQWMVYLLAAVMGLAGGLVLSYFQWRVLRRQVKGAGIWLPANMLAWMLGMPLIFWGIDRAQLLQGTALQILLMAGVLLATGAVVGGVHGLALLKLAHKGKTAAG